MKPFNSDIGAIYGKLGHANVYETKWPSVYSYRYTDPRVSIRDTIESMAAHGWITLRH
jgi:hypothetical protein